MFAALIGVRISSMYTVEFSLKVSIDPTSEGQPRIYERLLTLSCNLVSIQHAVALSDPGYQQPRVNIAYIKSGFSLARTMFMRWVLFTSC